MSITWLPFCLALCAAALPAIAQTANDQVIHACVRIDRESRGKLRVVGPEEVCRSRNERRVKLVNAEGPLVVQSSTGPVNIVGSSLNVDRRLGVGFTGGADTALHVIGDRIRLQRPGSAHLIDLRSEDEHGKVAISSFGTTLAIGAQAPVLLQPYPGHGNVGIGIVEEPRAKLDVGGTTRTQVLEITGGADIAEPLAFSSLEGVEPGSLVVVDDQRAGLLKVSSSPYDSRVAGIVSGANHLVPGLTLRATPPRPSERSIALSGRVYALATDENGPIRPGDLVTTSSRAGRAMRASDPMLRAGAVVGKAMSALDRGEGMVLVLVDMQ